MSLLGLIPKDKRRALAENLLEYQITAERLETKVNLLLEAAKLEGERKACDTYYARLLAERKVALDPDTLFS